MSEQKTKTVGSGMTQYEVAWSSPKSVNSEGIGGALRRAARFAQDPFQNRFGADVEAIAMRLANLRAATGPDHQFEPYAEEGWFCEHITVEFNRAKRAAGEGAISRGLDHAARMGMLLGEMQLKFDWEAAALSGAASLRGSAIGAEKRKESFKARDDRIRSEWPERFQKLGNKSAAKEAIAKQFGIGRRQLNRILANK